MPDAKAQNDNLQRSLDRVQGELERLDTTQTVRLLMTSFDQHQAAITSLLERTLTQIATERVERENRAAKAAAERTERWGKWTSELWDKGGKLFLGGLVILLLGLLQQVTGIPILPWVQK